MIHSKYAKKYKDPNELIIFAMQKIPRKYKLSFFSAIACGIITHIYFFIRNFINEDYLGYLNYYSNHLGSGRWMPQIMTGMLPVVIGTFAILLLALTAVITISVLEINRPIYIIIVSALVVTFPSLSYSFGYLFMTEVYSIALFLAALSVWCSKRFKFGFLIGAIFLACSLGEYQSYVSYAMTLSIIRLLQVILENKKLVRDWVKELFNYLLMGALGVVLYFIILKFLLYINKINLLDYKGISKMGEIPITQIPGLLQRTYIGFCDFFSGKTFFSVSKTIFVVYFLIILSIFILELLLIYKRRIYRNTLSLTGIIVLNLLIPLSVNIVDFIAPLTDTTSLNIYSMVLVFIIPIVILEVFDEEPVIYSTYSNFKNIISYFVVILDIFLSIHYYVLSNTYYLKLSEYTQYTVALDNRILARIEPLKEFAQHDPVAIISNNSSPLYHDGDDLFSPAIIHDIGLRKRFVGFSESVGDDDKSTWKFSVLVNDILGVKINNASSNKINLIKNSDEYLGMGVWPEKDCVKVIDDIIVVNFIPAIRVNSELTSKGIDFTAESPKSVTGENYLYAWYVYKNGERKSIKWYSEKNKFSFKTNEKGKYYALLFVKDKDGNSIAVVKGNEIIK